MKSKFLCSCAILVLSVSSPALAEVEPWYAYWGIGITDNSYPKDIEESFNAIESLPGINRTDGAIDMLGFYWPLQNDQTILGFVISGSYDRLDDGKTFLQLNQYLYSLSTMHFFGEAPGHGFLLRGDIGVSKTLVQTSFSGDTRSDSGSGFLVGTGYGLPISEGSRLILGINYSNKKIEGDTYSSTTFSIAGLW